MSPLSRRLLLALPWVAGALLCLGVHVRHRIEVSLALENHRRESRQEARQVAGSLNRALQQIHDNLRTVARLPGVRGMSSDCAGLGDDARRSVRVLYESLADAGALSELYLLPIGFDPDLGESQPLREPCASFDFVVSGREAGVSDEIPGAVSALERIEIHEHRALARQLEWLVANFPSEAQARALSHYPVVSGPEMLTSDNSHFDPSAPDDRDRAGIALSVPIYGAAGEIRGSAGGVILSHALRDLLPTGDYALRNQRHGIAIEPHFAGQWQASREWIERVEPDPSLAYSETLQLLAPDAAGPWVLWVGTSPERFAARSDVASARAFQRFGLAAGVATAVAATLGIAVLAERRRRTARHVRRLTKIARRMQKILGE